MRINSGLTQCRQLPNSGKFVSRSHSAFERKEEMSIVSRFKDVFAAGGPNLLNRKERSGARTVALLALVWTVGIAIFIAVLALPSEIMANDHDDNGARTFTVDVAFSNPYFQNSVNRAQAADAFFPGDTFLQPGVIYPEGTIPGGATPFDPVTHPGAIGTYRARGTWTTDLPHFMQASGGDKSAPSEMAFATEMFSFTSDLGGIKSDRSSIMTDGSMPNAYFSARRVVIGGTRGFRDFVGEVHEENIGENVLPYCNLRVTFKVHKAADDHGR
jgi:hypothetical protein